MKPAHLVACRSCGRHVRVTESTCPFCLDALGVALRSTPRPRPPSVRLSRAALYAFGVGAATLGAKCPSSSESAPVVSVDAAVDGRATDSAADSPPDVSDDADDDASYDAEHNTGDDAAYGCPPFEDDGGDSGC